MSLFAMKPAFVDQANCVVFILSERVVRPLHDFSTRNTRSIMYGVNDTMPKITARPTTRIRVSTLSVAARSISKSTCPNNGTATNVNVVKANVTRTATLI
jgi:hypothetical protein